VWWSYSSKEILNGGSCATNLTKFGQIAFKQYWSLHQTKLETDSQNGFTLSRHIFFISNIWLNEPWLYQLEYHNTWTYLHHSSIQERCRPCFIWSLKQKTYNMKVVWNCVMKLLTKEKFKRLLVCYKFDKIWSNRFQMKLKITSNKTRNG
jgi:hypothetical protein